MVIKFRFIHFGVANKIILCDICDLHYIVKNLNENVLTLIFQLV